MSLCIPQPFNGQMISEPPSVPSRIRTSSSRLFVDKTHYVDSRPGVPAVTLAR